MNPKSMSLQLKLFLAFALVTVLAVLLPAVYSRDLLDQEHVDLAKNNTLVQAKLLKSILESKPSREQVEQLFDAGKNLALRITLTDQSGKVIKDSHLPRAAVFNLDNHNDRPEIELALQNGQGTSFRHSNTLAVGMVYGAVALNEQSGGGIIRVAVPLAEVTNTDASQLSAMGIILALGLVACIFLAVFISRRVRTSIAEMTAVVEAISTGATKTAGLGGAAGSIGKPGTKARVHLQQMPGREFIPLAHAVNRMAENMEEYVQTTRDQQTQLSTILNSLYEGVLVLDQSGRVRSYNYAFQDLYPGIEYGVGKQLIETIPLPELQCRVEEFLQTQDLEPDLNAAGNFRRLSPTGTDVGKAGQMEQVGQAVQAGQGANDSLHFQTPEGHFIFAHISKPVRSSEFLGAVLVFYDATQIMKLEKVRRDFVSNVSHELRTPLTAIASSAEILMGLDDLQDEYKNFAKVIYKHSAMLSRMVADLLELARVEDYRQSIEFAVINPLNPLEDALELCKKQAEAKNIQFRLDLPQNISVRANGPLLAQVFRNILENACRYSPQAGVIVIKAKPENGDVLFMLGDNGPGIPKSDLPRIFERFYQVEKERNPNTTGIGLAICKHIIERHQGRIWAKSPYGDYATAVLFTLPKVEPKAELK